MTHPEKRIAARTLTIKKVSKWETSDGQVHTSHAMAEQHVMTVDLVLRLEPLMPITGGHDFLNIVGSHRKAIREWLDACDRMERAAMEGNKE